MRITHLATLTGTTVRALRYYEDLGLLRPLRSPARVRLYPPAAAETARRIVALRRLGAPAAAIAAVLKALDDGRRQPLEALVQDRLQALDAQVRLGRDLLADAASEAARPASLQEQAEARFRPAPGDDGARRDFSVSRWT